MPMPANTYCSFFCSSLLPPPFYAYILEYVAIERGHDLYKHAVVSTDLLHSSLLLYYKNFSEGTTQTKHA